RPVVALEEDFERRAEDGGHRQLAVDRGGIADASVPLLRGVEAELHDHGDLGAVTAAGEDGREPLVELPVDVPWRAAVEPEREELLVQAVVLLSVAPRRRVRVALEQAVGEAEEPLQLLP